MTSASRPPNCWPVSDRCRRRNGCLATGADDHACAYCFRHRSGRLRPRVTRYRRVAATHFVTDGRSQVRAFLRHIPPHQPHGETDDKVHAGFLMASALRTSSALYPIPNRRRGVGPLDHDQRATATGLTRPRAGTVRPASEHSGAGRTECPLCSLRQTVCTLSAIVSLFGKGLQMN